MRWVSALLVLAALAGAARTAEQNATHNEQIYDLGRLGFDVDLPAGGAHPDGAATARRGSAKPDHAAFDEDTFDEDRVGPRFVKDGAAGSEGSARRKLSTRSGDSDALTDDVLDAARVGSRLRRDNADGRPSRRLGPDFTPDETTDAALDVARVGSRLRRDAASVHDKSEDMEDHDGHDHYGSTEQYNHEQYDEGDINEVHDGYTEEDWQEMDRLAEQKEPVDAFAAKMLQDRAQWKLRRAKPAVLSGPDAAARLARVPRHIPVLTVLAMTVAMAAAAGLGALPFFFVKQLSTHWCAICTAVACGVMFAASFDLIHEGQPYGAEKVVFGIFLGGVFIAICQRWLDRMEGVRFGHLHGTRARRLVLMVGIMAAHAVGEGCGVGVSFCGDRGWAQGVLTTLAIGVHNVPEGLAKATLLVSQGATPPEALFWAIATCLPQPLVAVPSFIFVDTFTALLPMALGFAAGCMIWMVFAELLPDALDGAKSSEVATAATLSAAALEAIRMGFEALEGPAGAFLSPFNSGTWAKMLPALAEVAPGAIAAALAGAAIAGSSLPAPVVLGFSAVLMAALGAAPLGHQVLALPELPLVHTACAAAAGAAIVILLRRYALLALAGARGGVSRTTPALRAGSLTFRSGSGSLKASASGEDLFEGFDEAAGLYGGYNGATVRSMHHRKSDYGASAAPDSPSKGRRGGSGGGGGDAMPSALDLPARAAGLATLAALLAAGVPLGLHFTRLSAGAPPGSLALLPAFGAVLTVVGVASGGAVRAVVGRSVGAGGLIGAAVGAAPAAAALAALRTAPASPAAIVAALSYPESWAETLAAAAGGGLCIAALLQVAVAMHLQPRHARFGLVLGVLGAATVAGLATTGCAAGSVRACDVVHAFLQ